MTVENPGLEGGSGLLAGPEAAALVGSAGCAIVAVDPGGLITSWNPAARDLYGYSAPEILAEPIGILVGESAPSWLHRAVVGERVLDHEIQARRKDGLWLTVGLSAAPIFDSQGTIIGVVSISHDITARRQVDEEARRLAAIVKSSSDAVIGKTAGGVITSWNSGAEALYGYSRQEAVGQRSDFFLPPDRVDEEHQLLARLLAGERVREFETERRRKDGSIVPVSLTASVVTGAAGEVIGVATITRDVTERRRAEVLHSRLEHQHHIAETLQRTLLPETAPEVPGLAVATRYFPGGAGLEVGGDWYDVFTLPDGSVGVAVGDVVGRGIGAAAVMGQLRTALRAYAIEFCTPATVLSCLGRLVRSLDDSQFATVLYGVVNPEDGRLELASAGHLPPLLVGKDGEAGFMDVHSAPPLGVGDLPPTQVTDSMELGSIVLFYTDGLIERRGASIDDGMQALARAARGAKDVESLCKQVSDALGAADSPDDVALLAVSLVPG